MDICHPHNLRRAPAETDKPHGIRIRLAGDDPFANLVGGDWETTHWYATEHERDAALFDKSERHLYSRVGDEPRLIFEAIER